MFIKYISETYTNEFDAINPAIKTNIGRYLHLILAILIDNREILLRLSNVKKIGDCVSAHKSLFDSYYCLHLQSLVLGMFYIVESMSK